MARNRLLLYAAIPIILYSLFLLVTPVSWYPVTLGPKVVGSSSLICMLALLSMNFIFKNREADPRLKHEKEGSFLRLQNYFLMAFLLGLLGTVNDFPVDWQTDKMVHFMTGLLGTMALGQFIHIWYRVPLKRSLVTATMIVLCAGIVWEGMEYTSDRLFGTLSWGQYDQNVAVDTGFDITSNILGITAAVWLLDKRHRTKLD